MGRADSARQDTIKMVKHSHIELTGTSDARQSGRILV